MVRIVVSNFLGGSVSDHCFQSLCYMLRNWDGRENGVFLLYDFSIRVAPRPEGAKNDCLSFGGLVTGIPIYWNNSIDN